MVALALLMAGLAGCRGPAMGLVGAEGGAGGAAVVRVAGEAVTSRRYAIFIPADATPTERTAADELRTHLKWITGEELAIRPESQRGALQGFFIGRCGAYALADAERAALGTDGLVIRTHGRDIQLDGNQRGVLYAVSVFLEDHLHCRWFAPDCTRVPVGGTIDVGVIRHRFVPALENRALDYPEARDGRFAMRLRVNGQDARLDASRGGKIDYFPFVHSFDLLVPPAQHFAEHPEYFSLIDGKRTAENAQLCLTNPQVLAIGKARVRAWIKEHPGARIVSVSQNDNVRFCKCEACAKLAEEEGSQAGPMLHFVNAIARDIAADHPDVVIDTLAYQYTRRPPRRVKPEPNVTVRLCSIECCFAHPFDTCPENESFMEDLRGWSRICRRLTIWDYVINYAFTLAPWPNLYVIAPNIRTLIRHGATGIYEESNYFSPGGEMAALRTYLMGKTLWDPGYDTDRAIDEFVESYYGAAAPHIRDYIDLLHRRARRGDGPHPRIYAPPADHLDGDFITRAHGLFMKARAAVADDPARLRRVRLAHVGPLYMTLFEPPIIERIDKKRIHAFERHGDELALAFGPVGLDAGRDFWDTLAAEKITHFREGATIDRLRELTRPPGRLTVTHLDNDRVALEIVPGHGARILRMTDRKTGRQWMHNQTRDGKLMLTDSGSEIYSGKEWLSAGWNEPFEVVERDASRIVLRAKLDNGLELERSMTLGEGARVRMRDAIRNASDKPVEATLRVHPSLSIADLTQAHVLARTADGGDRRIALPVPTGPDTPADSRFLRGDDRPCNEWSLVDPAGNAKITHRILAGDIGEYFIDVHRPRSRVTLELWSPTRQLKPGEQIAIEHEYEMTSLR